MSTAAQCWWAERKMRRVECGARFRCNGDALCCLREFRRAVVLVLAAGFLTPAALRAQTANPTVAANQAKARHVLDQAIQALGGVAWLDVRAVRTTGATAGFFHGERTGTVAQTTDIVEFPQDSRPARERVDLAKGRVVHILVGRQGWEITYKGAKPLAPEKLAQALRWRDHSLRVALCVWYREPGTMLVDNGQSMDGNRLVDSVTLFDRQDASMTLEVDALTHLPRRLRFTWRDPAFHDLNRDAVEYDNYRIVNGIGTPWTITRTHNGETVYQRFLKGVHYDPQIPPDSFNPGKTAAHLR